MCEDLVVQTNGPYLRVVLPDFERGWAGMWSAVAFELEEGIQRAEVIAPCYPDDDSLACVRELVERLEGRGVITILEWQGTPPHEKAEGGQPSEERGQSFSERGDNDVAVPFIGFLDARRVLSGLGYPQS
jgi:hypothetical protein